MRQQYVAYGFAHRQLMGESTCVKATGVTSTGRCARQALSDREDGDVNHLTGIGSRIILQGGTLSLEDYTISPSERHASTCSFLHAGSLEPPAAVVCTIGRRRETAIRRSASRYAGVVREWRSCLRARFGRMSPKPVAQPLETVASLRLLIPM